MKNLVIDLGNTNRKLAVFNEGRMELLEQSHSFDIPFLLSFLKRVPGIERCILSSVIHDPAEVREFLAGQFHFVCLDQKTRLPLVVRDSMRATLGTDRIAASVAGADCHPGHHVLVINAGTCITYDLVGPDRHYLGGSISPGIGIRLKSLHTFTDKLPLVNVGSSFSLTGTNTEENILSGVILGATAEIEGIIARYLEQYPGLKVIISGGDHIYFIKWLKISIFALPNIVLTGLNKILEFNVQKT